MLCPKCFQFFMITLCLHKNLRMVGQVLSCLFQRQENTGEFRRGHQHPAVLSGGPGCLPRRPPQWLWQGHGQRSAETQLRFCDQTSQNSLTLVSDVISKH